MTHSSGVSRADIHRAVLAVDFQLDHRGNLSASLGSSQAQGRFCSGTHPDTHAANTPCPARSQGTDQLIDDTNPAVAIPVLTRLEESMRVLLRHSQPTRRRWFVRFRRILPSFPPF